MTHYLLDKPGYWGKLPSDLEGLRATAELEQIDFTMHVIGEETDDEAPVAIIVKFPPNAPIPRHAHVGHRFELIIEGSVQFGDEWLHKGDVMTAAEKEAYGPLLAGPEGALTVEIFSVRRGAYQLYADMGEGELQFLDARDPEAAAKAVLEHRSAS